MIPRFAPRLKGRELACALRPAPRDAIERFEAGLAETFEQREGVMFPYGRTGLMLLLEAMGLDGHEVICPAYTCVVVPHAIVHSGNEPVFVDSADDSFNMDLDAAEAAITERTGAIIPTSIFGYPVDLDRLEQIRARHPHVQVIQDCAHSFRARWNGRAVCPAGDAAIVGLNVSKIITSIFGGMVTTDDPELAARLRTVRDQRVHRSTMLKSLRRRLYLLAVAPALSQAGFGFVDRLARLGWLNHFVKYYDESVIDMPADHLDGVTPFEASVGLEQLERYDPIIATRRERARQYDEGLAGLEALVRPPLVDGATYSHYVPLCARRDEVITAARARGVQLGNLIEYVVPTMASYAERRSGAQAFPNTERYAAEALNLSVCVDHRGGERVLAAVRDAVDEVYRR